MPYSNVVLIVADTLRAKNLPSYGSDIDTTTFLKKQKSVSSYYSNSPWTVPAHATLFSGELPSEHGATTQNTYFEGENKLVEAFNKNGYDTYGVTENGLVTEHLGFGEEFNRFGRPDTFRLGAKSWNKIWEKDEGYSGRREKYADFLNLLFKNKDLESVKALKERLNPLHLDHKPESYNPTNSEVTIRRALNALNQDGKSFLFLNLMPVHASYTFEEEQKKLFLPEVSEKEIKEFVGFKSISDYLEMDFEDEGVFEVREKAYNASIKYLDSIIEGFYQKAPEDTLFVLIGDHGELIGEYNMEGTDLVDHHFGTFKELIEVPLYIFSKGQEPDLEIDGGLHDHVGLHEFLVNLAKNEDLKLNSNKLVRSEYFGKYGYNEQFDHEVQEGFEDLFKRKSFSLINGEFKYDLTSDGDFLWKINSKTEQKELRLDKTPNELQNKGEVFYRWRLE